MIKRIAFIIVVLIAIVQSELLQDKDREIAAQDKSYMGLWSDCNTYTKETLLGYPDAFYGAGNHFYERSSEAILPYRLSKRN